MKRVQSVVCFCGAAAILRDGKWGKWWACSRYPDCTGAVGCHDGTSKPLGRMADQATRDARKAAHAAFDPLWQDRGERTGLFRTAAYRWLMDVLDLSEDEAHMAMMDQETAERVVEVCQDVGPEDLEPYVLGVWSRG